MGGLGGSGGARSLYQFTLQDTDTEELYRWAPVLEGRIRQLPGIEDVSTDLQIKNPKVGLTHNLGGRPGKCVSFVSIVGRDRNN